MPPRGIAPLEISIQNGTNFPLGKTAPNVIVSRNIPPRKITYRNISPLRKTVARKSASRENLFVFHYTRNEFKCKNHFLEFLLSVD